MAILNVTPDSFSDGGCYLDIQTALDRAIDAIFHGAQILDVGAVSTRPGAPQVLPHEEWDRLKHVLPLLRNHLPTRCRISLDTGSPQVAWRCAEMGWIDMVNDVWAGKRVETGTQGKPMTTLHVAAHWGLACVLMHMPGDPQTMQSLACYPQSCVFEVRQFLKERAQSAANLGVKEIIIDPGIGFGKTLEHNLELLCESAIRSLKELGWPVLVGLSRKRFLGLLSGISLPKERDLISKHWEQKAITWGAQFIRSHVMPSEL